MFIWHVCTLWDPWWHFLSCSLRWHFLRAAFLDDIFPPNSATQWCVWWAGDMVTCVRWNLCWWCYCDLFWWHFPPFRHLEFGLVCFWGLDTLYPVPVPVYCVRRPISLTFQCDVGCWPNSRSSRSSSCENWRGSKDHKSGLCFCLWHGDQMLLNLSPGCFGQSHSLANKVLVKVTVQQRRFRHGSY